MKKGILVLLLLFGFLPLFAPPNCEAIKDDEACYAGCQKALDAITFRQGSWQSQDLFDESLELCPGFAYSHMQKAVPFVKRGLFIEWKTMIDKAVEYDPVEFLGYRGWCRLQFLRDYEGCISDIEQLRSMINYDLGFCQTGDYHLEIVLALCYKAIGKTDKAMQIYQSRLDAGNEMHTGLYDYYHYGVLQYELDEYDAAFKSFERQVEENDYMGETYYFMGLIQKEKGDMKNATRTLMKAREYYRSGKFRSDTYTETLDKIYLSEIESAIKELANEK
ncbi:MAG: tetratricopeptide repeat protein [Bacteroidota bacterium]